MTANETVPAGFGDLAEATAAARTIAVLAVEDGATEVDLARYLGVDRARTLRRWLGK